MESLQHFKKPWAHEHEPIKVLLDAVKSIKPTVLIGSSGVGKTFTKEVVETMSSFNEVSEKNYPWLSSGFTCYVVYKNNVVLQKPIILALSNPTSQSECTAEEAYNWSQVSLSIWVWLTVCLLPKEIRELYFCLFRVAQFMQAEAPSIPFKSMGRCMCLVR